MGTELERLLQWSWFIREQSAIKHKREDIEAFIEFCQAPRYAGQVSQMLLSTLDRPIEMLLKLLFGVILLCSLDS